jgi:hypothetical protein
MTTVAASRLVSTWGMLVQLMGYEMMGLFPPRLLLIWGCIGVVEMILVSLAGAWVYRE